MVFQEVVFRMAYPIPELSNFDRANYLPGTEKGTKYAFYRNSNWFWESSLDTNHQFVHELNQYGFRDREWKIEKDSDQKRVMLIGDSFLEGVMAEQSETIVEHFRKKDEKETFDLMNMGIMGTGISSYLKIIADAAPVFNPDIVCLVLYSNDITSEELKLPSKSFTPQYFNSFKPRGLELLVQHMEGNPIHSRFNFKQNAFLPSIKEKTFPWYGKEEVLLNMVSKEVRNSMVLGKMNPFLVNQVLREKVGLLKQANLDTVFEFISNYSKESNTEFVVCYVPLRHQVTQHYYPYEKSCCKQCPDSLDMTEIPYKQHQSYLKAICSDYQIDFIDYTPLVEQEELNQNYLYWNYDGHMNSKGYRLIGESLFEELSLKVH